MMDVIQYATVKPYCGWWEAESIARPYLQVSVAGVGFFLAWLLHRTFERWMGWDRRDGTDRRVP